MSMFCNYDSFYAKGLSATRPSSSVQDHPLSAARDCLFNIFAATVHIGGRSSIRNLRTLHAVVTRIHLSHNREDSVVVRKENGQEANIDKTKYMVMSRD
jgi:hypothetical protein